MKILSASYATTAVEPGQYPRDRLPEVALLGRSNVGKSSAINRLLNRKALAHTSSTPGKTHALNFYLVNDALYLVDLPGYGYAKVSKADRDRWAAFIEGYLGDRPPLAAAILVVDLRHPPTADDRQMAAYVQARGLPTVVLATKADQVPRARQREAAAVIRTDLALGDDDALVLFSAKEALGPVGELSAGVDAAWREVIQRVPALRR